MAKSKKKRKKNAAGAPTATGISRGIAAGAATFVAGQAVKTVIKEIVEAGTDRLLHTRSRLKPRGPDIGLLILRTLEESASQAPVTVVQMVQVLRINLLDVADALRGLRRLRLVKFADGRRAVRLTGQGRETLEMLRRPPEENVERRGAEVPAVDASDDAAEDQRNAGSEDGSGESAATAAPFDNGASVTPPAAEEA